MSKVMLLHFHVRTWQRVRTDAIVWMMTVERAFMLGVVVSQAWWMFGSMNSCIAWITSTIPTKKPMTTESEQGFRCACGGGDGWFVLETGPVDVLRMLVRHHPSPLTGSMDCPLSSSEADEGSDLRELVGNEYQYQSKYWVLHRSTALTTQTHRQLFGCAYQCSLRMG